MSEHGARFYIAAGWGGDVEPPLEWESNWLASLERLKPEMADKDFDVDEDGLYCQLDYALADFIGAPDVPNALAQRVDEDLPRFVRSEMFAAESGPSARRPSK